MSHVSYLTLETRQGIGGGASKAMWSAEELLRYASIFRSLLMYNGSLLIYSSIERDAYLVLLLPLLTVITY